MGQTSYDSMQVSDAEIVRLYSDIGLSQKDIFRLYGVPILRIRNVLRAADCETLSFRKVGDAMKNVVKALVKTGMEYHDIETVTDISYHYIREYIPSSECMLKHESRLARKEALNFVAVPISFPHRKEFLEEYRAGKTFTELCVQLQYTEAQIAICYALISLPDIEMHKANLRKILIAESEFGLSKTALARKHLISTSVVQGIMQL